MAKFDNILIFSDIDCTYLDSNRRAVPRNEEAVRYFQSEGGLFTFATGRMEKNLPTVIPNIREIAQFPVLLSNGASLYDFRTDTRIFALYMDKETVGPLLDLALSEFPQVGVRATVPGGFHYVFDHPLLEKDVVKVRDCTWKKPISEWDFARIFKIVFRGENEELSILRDRIAASFGTVFQIVMSEDGILEVQKKGVSKGSTIEMIRAGLAKRGTPKKIFCVGDYENDLEMLRVSDFAACPANAIDSVKAIADIRLCHCDDGAIADLIGYIECHPEILR